MQYPKFNNYLKDNYEWTAPVNPEGHFSSEEKEAPEKMNDLNASAVKGREDKSAPDELVQVKSEARYEDGRGGTTINEEMRLHAGLTNKNRIMGNIVNDEEGYDEMEKKNASATKAYNDSKYAIPSLPPMAESNNANRYVLTDTNTRQKVKLTKQESTIINTMISIKEGKQFQAAADSGDIKKGMTYNVVKAVGNTYQLVEVESGKGVTAQYGQLLGVAAPFPSN